MKIKKGAIAIGGILLVAVLAVVSNNYTGFIQNRFAPDAVFKVLGPDVLFAGQKAKITWDTSPQNAAAYPFEKIEFCKNHLKECVVIKAKTPNIGEVTMTIPNSLKEGKGFFKLTARKETELVAQVYSVRAVIIKKVPQSENNSSNNNNNSNDNSSSNTNNDSSAVSNASVINKQFGFDKVGLFDQSKAQFQLKADNMYGANGTTILYGTPGVNEIALMGDWNGDGVATPGVFDPASNHFYLRNANTSGNSDIDFGFGTPGRNQIPLVGDWDGDGKTTIGVFDPASNHFYLRNSNTTGNSDVDLGFGNPNTGQIPVAGDWNSDGKDTIGVYDRATATFFLRNTNTTGNSDVAFNLGTRGNNWWPVAGRAWDACGTSDECSTSRIRPSSVGLYDPTSGVFYLKKQNTSGNADIVFQFAPGLRPVVGRWSL